MILDHFTVSYGIDIYKNGDKSSHFVSASVKCVADDQKQDDHVSIEKLSELQMQLSFHVSKSAILDAMVRGHLTQEEAKDRIEVVKSNHELIINSYREKQAE